MKKFIPILLCFFFLKNFSKIIAQEKTFQENTSTWQSPDEDILNILYAPQSPKISLSPSKTHMILTDRIVYPSLAELAAPMLKLAGTRVNPKNNYYHGRHGGINPRIVTIKNGKETQLDLPADAEIFSTNWTVDGKRFALSVGFEDRI